MNDMVHLCDGVGYGHLFTLWCCLDSGTGCCLRLLRMKRSCTTMEIRVCACARFGWALCLRWGQFICSTLRILGTNHHNSSVLKAQDTNLCASLLCPSGAQVHRGKDYLFRWTVRCTKRFRRRIVGRWLWCLRRIGWCDTNVLCLHGGREVDVIALCGCSRRVWAGRVTLLPFSSKECSWWTTLGNGCSRLQKRPWCILNTYGLLGVRMMLCASIGRCICCGNVFKSVIEEAFWTSRVVQRWLLHSGCLRLGLTNSRQEGRERWRMHLLDCLKRNRFEGMLCISCRTVSNTQIRLRWEAAWLWVSSLRCGGGFWWVWLGYAAWCAVPSAKGSTEEVSEWSPATGDGYVCSSWLGRKILLGVTVGRWCKEIWLGVNTTWRSSERLPCWCSKNRFENRRTRFWRR